MKELSIEQKARRYDEAKTIMGKYLKSGNAGVIAENTIKKAFPELRESDDEKIKQAIIEHFAGSHSSMYPYKGFTKKQILDWIERQGEQKPNDNAIKPKFKIGDWIVYKDSVWKICNISLGNYYELLKTNNEVSIRHFEGVDKTAHLWTIQDAKDGDVLFYDSTCGFTFIYDGINPEGALLYSYVESNDGSQLLKYNIGKPNVGIGHATDKNIYPATKVQRDILFQKMKEKGYEWDGEKKELKKIEPKFKAGDWIVFNGLTLCIKVVVNGFYVTISKDGVTNSYDWSIDNAARLWTIQEARDGDVLATSRYILIFEKFLHKDGAVSYCHYDFDSSTPHFDFNKDDNWYFGQEAKVSPAAKEQRDLLFQKMKDAGYTFDFEKKELKKIEPKSAEWHREDEQNLNACLGYISDEFLRRWLKDTIHAKYDKTTCSEEDKKEFEPKFKVGDII